MPTLRGKCSDGGERPVHDKTPSQEDEVKLGSLAVILDHGQLHGLLVSLLPDSCVELARVDGYMHRRRFCVAVLLRGGWLRDTDAPSCYPSSSPGDDWREHEEQEDAPHDGKLGHEPAIVGLVETEFGRGVHLNEQGCVSSGKLESCQRRNSKGGTCRETHNAQEYSRTQKNHAKMPCDFAVGMAKPLGEQDSERRKETARVLFAGFDRARHGFWCNVRQAEVGICAGYKERNEGDVEGGADINRITNHASRYNGIRQHGVDESQIYQVITHSSIRFLDRA